MKSNFEEGNSEEARQTTLGTGTSGRDRDHQRTSPRIYPASKGTVTAMASLRLATSVPRAGLSLHSRQLQQRWLLPSTAHHIIRNASTERPAPPKPRVLEKPDKFRPPSHPSRIRSKPRYNYGPDLTQEQKTVRQYPHMMPPEGSLMHWFLTNRSIHVFISVVIIPSLFA